MKHTIGETWRVAGQSFICVPGIGRITCKAGHKPGDMFDGWALKTLLIQDHEHGYEVWEAVRPGTP